MGELRLGPHKPNPTPTTPCLINVNRIYQMRLLGLGVPRVVPMRTAAQMGARLARCGALRARGGATVVPGVDRGGWGGLG